MTRHDTIHRRGRQVHVERRPLDPRTALARLRAGSVDPEPDPRHLGGVMTGERGRALDGRRCQPKGLPCKPKPVGCQPCEATQPEIRADLSTGRPLLAEISDLFRRSPERCPKPLYETRV